MIARALIVGVAQYQSVPGALAAVEADVDDVAQLLSDPRFGVQADRLTQLRNENATAGAIRAALAQAAADPADEGAFVFYFSGHGERAVVQGSE